MKATSKTIVTKTEFILLELSKEEASALAHIIGHTSPQEASKSIITPITCESPEQHQNTKEKFSNHQKVSYFIDSLYNELLEHFKK